MATRSPVRRPARPTRGADLIYERIRAAARTRRPLGRVLMNASRASRGRNPVRPTTRFGGHRQFIVPRPLPSLAHGWQRLDPPRKLPRLNVSRHDGRRPFASGPSRRRRTPSSRRALASNGTRIVGRADLRSPRSRRAELVAADRERQHQAHVVFRRELTIATRRSSTGCHWGREDRELSIVDASSHYRRARTTAVLLMGHHGHLAVAVVRRITTASERGPAARLGAKRGDERSGQQVLHAVRLERSRLPPGRCARVQGSRSCSRSHVRRGRSGQLAQDLLECSTPYVGSGVAREHSRWTNRTAKILFAGRNCPSRAASRQRARSQRPRSTRAGAEDSSATEARRAVLQRLRDRRRALRGRRERAAIWRRRSRRRGVDEVAARRAVRDRT